MRKYCAELHKNCNEIDILIEKGEIISWKHFSRGFSEWEGGRKFAWKLSINLFNLFCILSRGYYKKWEIIDNN